MSYQLGQFRRPQLDSYSTFAADEELFTKIQSECKDTIEYISKLGIYYVGNFDLDLIGKR